MATGSGEMPVRIEAEPRLGVVDFVVARGRATHARASRLCSTYHLLEGARAAIDRGLRLLKRKRLRLRHCTTQLYPALAQI